MARRFLGDTLHDCHVTDLTDWLQAGDLLVLNDTRVIPARLTGLRLRHSSQGLVLTGTLRVRREGTSFEDLAASGDLRRSLN